MEPKTLKAAIEYFAKPENCRAYLVARRWPDGKVTCPQCGGENVKFSEKHNRWQCASHHVRVNPYNPSSENAEAVLIDGRDRHFWAAGFKADEIASFEISHFENASRAV